MAAGKLREVLSFQRRTPVDDGAGNEVSGAWVEQCKASAARTPMSGGTEAVMASRLEGVQPFSVCIRYSLATSAITPDWRAVDTRTGATYAIKTAVPRVRMDYIDLVCISGPAE